MQPSQRQPDRQHEQRGDFVRHERIERTVAHFQVRERISLLYGYAQARREHLVEAGDAGATAAGIHGAHGRTREFLGEKRRRALDAHGDLFAAALEHRVDMRRPIVALEQLLRFLQTQTRARAAGPRGSGACRR
jgi:hypothetical protein